MLAGGDARGTSPFLAAGGGQVLPLVELGRLLEAAQRVAEETAIVEGEDRSASMDLAFVAAEHPTT